MYVTFSLFFVTYTPLPPMQLGPLFWTEKKCFARMTEENFDDYNDGCKDNYDNNHGNIIIW